MNHFILRKHTNNDILYEGCYSTFRHCLEAAVNKGIKLPHINLRNQNLTNANIDGVFMPFADFSGSNLSGANLSESILHNSDFRNTALYNCCMACSDLHESNFSGASFGATLINEANLKSCLFSTLSCFDLDFVYCETLEDCTFIEPDNRCLDMSGPPVVIKGLFNMPIILFDKCIKIGNKTIKRSALPGLTRLLSEHNFLPDIHQSNAA